MRRTRKVLLALALFGALGQNVMADEGAQARLAELEQQYKEAEGSYSQKFAAVKAEYEAFAAANAGTEEGLSALLFLLRNTWWEREAGTMSASAGAVLEKILESHADSPRLDELVQMKYVLSAEQSADLFRQLVARSPHAVVKAEALLALALPDLRGPNASRGRERLASLKERFGDVKRRGLIPYAEIADAHLTKHDRTALAVGRTAPEITGHDLDGNPMKLSDHLGKVVVLDFWGDW